MKIRVSLLPGLFVVIVLLIGRPFVQGQSGQSKTEGLHAILVAKIESWGGTATVDSQTNEVVQVSLASTKITDQELGQLAPLNNLRVLNLSDTSTRDASLNALSSFRKLVALDLSTTFVNGEGLRHLSQLPELQILGLSGSQSSDRTLQELCSLAALKRIDLSGSRVTDAGLSHLEKIPQLEQIDLRGTRVTGTGFGELGNLMQLHSVILADTRLTNEGLKNAGGRRSIDCPGRRQYSGDGFRPRTSSAVLTSTVIDIRFDSDYGCRRTIAGWIEGSQNAEPLRDARD